MPSGNSSGPIGCGVWVGMGEEVGEGVLAVLCSMVAVREGSLVTGGWVGEGGGGVNVVPGFPEV